MSLIKKLTKKALLAPVEVVKGVVEAFDEVVNGKPKEPPKS